MKYKSVILATMVALVAAVLVSCSQDARLDLTPTSSDELSKGQEGNTYAIDHPAGLAAVAYIEQHLADYELRSEVDLLAVKSVSWGLDNLYHVFLEQYYYDVRVDNGYLIVNLDSSLVVGSVVKHVVSNVEISTAYRISADSAFQIAMQQYWIFGSAETVSSVEQLVVYRTYGNDYICWHLYLKAENETATGDYMIDANTGSFLKNDIIDIDGGGEI